MAQGCRRTAAEGVNFLMRRLGTLVFLFAVLLLPATAHAFGSAYVANAGSANVSQYAIATAGELSALTPATVAAGSLPVGVAVTPDGKSAYVTNLASGSVSQYDIDALTGALSPKTPATVAAGTKPFGIAVGRFPLAPPKHPTATSVKCSPDPVIAASPTTCTATVTDTAAS